MKTTVAIFVLLLAISLLMGCNDSRQPTAPRTDDKAKAVLDEAGDSAKVADLDAKAATLDKAAPDLEAQADTRADASPMSRVWVAKKVRRHLMRPRGRKRLGWKRWSTSWLYNT